MSLSADFRRRNGSRVTILYRVGAGLVMLALGYLAVERFVLAPRRQAAELATVASIVQEARQNAPVRAVSVNQSIAVLPFVNMSSDRDQEYFADGISEELLNLLAQIPQLRVIARTSSFSFKGKEADIATIAKALNVDNVLEGSVRKSGSRIRITAQLIRTADSSHLWSETYDRELSDIFAVQDEISAAVVGQLKIKLLGGAAPRAKVVDPRAYALFLRARQLSRQHTAEGLTLSISLFQQALAIDTGYAAAWSELGLGYSNLADNSLHPIAEGYRLAREAVNRALALDPDLALAHARRGYIAISYDRDLATAAQELTRALKLAPDDSEVLGTAAVLAQALGRLETAIALGEAVTSLDPVSGTGHANLGVAYYYANRPDAAVASLRTALTLSPGFIAAHFKIAMALLLKNQPQAALAELQKEPSESFRLIGLPMVWHALGDDAKSDAALREMIAKHEKEMSYNIAYALAYRNEADRAFEWLDKAVSYQDPGLSSVAFEPLFANLHRDSRWLPFLRKIGKAPEQLADIEFDARMPEQRGAKP